MSYQNENVKMGFQSVDELYHDTALLERAYFGESLIWGDAPATGTVWGPHPVLDITLAWALSPTLNVGDDIFDEFGISNFSGIPGTSITITFANTGARDDFSSAVTSFYVGTTELLPADAADSGTDGLTWFNAAGQAAGSEGIGETEVSGTYTLADTDLSTTITGTLDEVNSTNFKVDNYADSGHEADRYKYYSSNMLRDTGAQLRILVDMEDNSDGAGDWNAEYNLVALECKIDGVAFTHTAISQNLSGGASLLDFRMTGTTASVDAFLLNADNKPFEFTFTVTEK